MEFWRGAIIGMNTIILVLGIIFLCYSMMVYDACYVDPCYEGSGLEELWKVNKGIGFTTIAAGICTCMIAIFIDVFLSLGLDPSATFTIGYVLGASSVTGLVMLDMTFVWAAEWNLVYDLHQLKGDNAIFDESGRHMVVRTELIGQSKAMLGLAIACCLLQVVVVLQFLKARNAVIAKFGLQGGTGGGDRESPLLTGGLQD